MASSFFTNLLSAMASSMESGWLYLITQWSEFQLMTFGTFLISVFMLVLSEVVFMFVERVEWMRKYKIQSKTVSGEDKRKCVNRVVVTLLGVILPTTILSYPTIFVPLGIKTSLPLPPWHKVVLDIIFGSIVTDFFFYWGHRFLHTKWIYKHIHSVHHEYSTPFGLTGVYAHPAEFIFLGMIITIGISMITRPHLVTYWVWIIVQELETFEIHCGYHFPWSISNFLPFYGGAKFHDVHHRVSNTNFGFPFTYMDWIFGTDKGHKKF